MEQPPEEHKEEQAAPQDRTFLPPPHRLASLVSPNSPSGISSHTSTQPLLHAPAATSSHRTTSSADIKDNADNVELTSAPSLLPPGLPPYDDETKGPELSLTDDVPPPPTALPPPLPPEDDGRVQDASTGLSNARKSKYTKVPVVPKRERSKHIIAAEDEARVWARKQRQKKEVELRDAQTVASAASPVTTIILRKILAKRAREAALLPAGNASNKRTFFSREKTLMRQLTGLANPDDSQSKSPFTSVHLWLGDRAGVVSVVLFQLFMYCFSAWAVVASSPTDGICSQSSGSWATGSWNAGLALALGRRLFWGEQSRGIADIVEGYAGYASMAAALATLQVVDLVIGGRPLCSETRDSDVTAAIWSGICLVGWFSAWEAVWKRAEDRDDEVTVVALLNPVGGVSVACGFLGKLWVDTLNSSVRNNPSRFHSFERCCCNLGLLFTGLLLFPILLIHAIVEKTSNIEEETDVSFGRMWFRTAGVCALCVSLLLSAVTGAHGMAGLGTAILLSAAGGLTCALSVDRLLWMIWWVVILIGWPGRVSEALSADGFQDQSDRVLIFLIAFYVLGRTEETEIICNVPLWQRFKLKHVEPLGGLVVRLKRFGMKSIVNLSSHPLVDSIYDDNPFALYRKIHIHRLDVNEPQDTGPNLDTALHIAVKNGSDACVEVLVEAKADVNKENDFGESSLDYAVEMNPSTLPLLIEAGAHIKWCQRLLQSDPNRDHKLHSNLHKAGLDPTALAEDVAEHGVAVQDVDLHALFKLGRRAERCLRLILDELGSDGLVEYEASHIQLKPLLFEVLQQEQLEETTLIMLRLLLEHDADVELRNNSGNKILHMAVSQNCEGLVDLLLEYDADVNSTANTLGRAMNSSQADESVTALQVAVRRGFTRMAKKLLHMKADPLCVDNRGVTALYEAVTASENALDLIDLLLLHGAQLEQVHEATSLQTVLMHAVIVGKLDVVQDLLRRSADVSACDATGQTVIHHAVTQSSSSGNLSMLRCILAHVTERGDRILNQTDHTGSTPLRRAIWLRQVDVVYVLMDTVTKLHSQDDQKVAEANQLFFEALLNGIIHNEEHLLAFLKVGADPNGVDSEGRTPLHYAACYRSDRGLAERLMLQGATPTGPKAAASEPESPLLLACRLGHTNMCFRMLRVGANAFAKSVDGFTCLEMSVLAALDQQQYAHTMKDCYDHWWGAIRHILVVEYMLIAHPQILSAAQRALGWALETQNPIVTRVLLDHGVKASATVMSSYEPGPGKLEAEVRDKFQELEKKRRQKEIELISAHEKNKTRAIGNVAGEAPVLTGGIAQDQFIELLKWLVVDQDIWKQQAKASVTDNINASLANEEYKQMRSAVENKVDTSNLDALLSNDAQIPAEHKAASSSRVVPKPEPLAIVMTGIVPQSGPDVLSVRIQRSWNNYWSSRVLSPFDNDVGCSLAFSVSKDAPEGITPKMSFDDFMKTFKTLVKEDMKEVQDDEFEYFQVRREPHLDVRVGDNVSIDGVTCHHRDRKSTGLLRRREMYLWLRCTRTRGSTRGVIPFHVQLETGMMPKPVGSVQAPPPSGPKPPVNKSFIRYELCTGKGLPQPPPALPSKPLDHTLPSQNAAQSPPPHAPSLSFPPSGLLGCRAPFVGRFGASYGEVSGLSTQDASNIDTALAKMFGWWPFLQEDVPAATEILRGLANRESPPSSATCFARDLCLAFGLGRAAEPVLGRVYLSSWAFGDHQVKGVCTTAQLVLGWVYWKGLLQLQRDKSLAVHWWALASSHSDAAMFHLARALQPGKKDSPAHVKELFVRVANHGHALAQYELGHIALKEESILEACQWFKKSANVGYAEAQFGYAVLLEQVGLPLLGANHGKEEAQRWYTAAAEQGHEDAKKRLSELKQGGSLKVSLTPPAP